MSGILYGTPYDLYRPYRPIEITAYGVPWQQPVNPYPDLGPGVYIKPCWPEPNSTTTTKIGKEPSMVDRCKQRRDELKAELETLEAMIAAAEKAGAK